CRDCPHRNACPIDGWPDDPVMDSVPAPAEIDLTGPREPVRIGEPSAVWLTAESLGVGDPAAAAHPDLPVVFVFDEALLTRLQLDAKRLVFLTETLAELGEERDVELYLGDPSAVLADRPVAVTHAPVPGFATRAAAIAPVTVYPWPWLRIPRPGSVRSFSAWRKAVDRP
ncbi:MAG: deoxyribodipyrimidine photolyase, partial [Acidimicrobiales bacterium]